MNVKQSKMTKLWLPVLTGLWCFAASSANASPSLSLGVGQALAGQTITIPVTLKNNNTVASALFDIQYDASQLTAGTPLAGTVLTSTGHGVSSSQITADTLRIVITPPVENTAIDTGTVVEIPFTVAADANSNSKTLTLTNLTFHYDQALLAPADKLINGLIVTDLNGDTDGDGMSDGWEYANGLDATDAADASIDSDGDSLSNLDEFIVGANPRSQDGDGDGYLDPVDAFPMDVAEWLDFDGDGIGNNTDLDDDNDGMLDSWEVQYNLNPLDASDAVLDLDSDGLTNLDEYQQGSDPTQLAGVMAITWTDLVGVTANGNSLTRNGGSGWSAGAASEQVIPDDGAVEFIVIATNTHRMFGLSNVNANASWDSIAYAIYARNDATILIYENGVLSGSYGAYQYGDVLRVERVGTMIVYKQNETIIYTSSVPSTGNLIADSSIYTSGAQIVDAMVYGSLQDSDGDLMGDYWEAANGLNPNDSADATLNGDSDGLTNLDEYQNNTDPSNWDSDADGMSDGWEVRYSLNPLDAVDATQDLDGDGIDNLTEYQQGSDPTQQAGVLAITWTDLVGATASGNTLTATASGWGNSGAASQQTIPGDGAVEFTAIATNTHRMIGLSNTNANASWDSIAYAIYARNDAAILIYENGVLAGTYGVYQSGDVLRVERIGSTIEYKQNGNIIYSSAIVSNGSLIVDTSIYTSGAQIVDAMVYGAQ